MTDPQTTVLRPATLLQLGDRIAAGFLPPTLEAAVVDWVRPYGQAEPWVCIGYIPPSGVPSSTYLLADSLVPLEWLFDATGAGYSDLSDRLAGEDTPAPYGTDLTALGRAARSEAGS